MSPTITGTYVDDNPVDSIYVFDFEDNPPVAVSRIRTNRHSKYDGKLFSVWVTNPENYTPNEDGSAASVHEIDDAELPEKLERSEMYIQDAGGEKPTSEMLDAIDAYMSSLN